MRSPFLLLSLALLACAPEPPCDGMEPRDGEELQLQLVELGYEVIGEDDFPSGQQEVLQTQEAWEAATAAWGGDGGLSPDFDRQAVWPNGWVYGGCGEWYDYTAWRWGDEVRVRAEYGSEREVCEAYMPQLDLVVVDLDGAGGVGWCD